jgi:SAM-dependent methyltransferase
VQDPYAPIARFYDRIAGEHGEDIALYEALAYRFGDPVLEIGAGTGRVAIPLAQAGHTVVALDASPAMIALGRAKAGDAGRRIEWRDGRIETFEDQRQFGLVFCAIDSFLHLATTEAQSAALATVRRLLRPDGCLALDLPTLAAWTDWAPGVRPLDLVWTEPAPVGGVTYAASFQVDPATQTRRVTHVVEEVGADGGVRRWLTTFDLRFIGRYEAEHLLARSGFRVTGVHGDYDLGPLLPASERMIVLAEPEGAP